MTSGDNETGHSHRSKKVRIKRKRRAESASNQFDMANAPQLPPQPDLPEFSLTSGRPSSTHKAESPGSHADDDSQEWQTIESGRPVKRAKKLPKENSDNYPAFTFSPTSRLQSHVKISDLQNLVLYILANGTAPQFVSVRHRNQFRKVVVLMVPGLEKSMFNLEAADDSEGKQKENDYPSRNEKDRDYSSPDSYYPTRLNSETLPADLQPLSAMFEHLWPVKTPGDDKYGRMHSPFHAMLTAPISKAKEEKKWQKNKKGATPAQEPAGWQNIRTRVTEFIHSPDELLEHDYTLHPASYDNENEKAALAEHRRSEGVSPEHGWVDTLVKTFDEGSTPENEIESGSLTAGRELLAMDCEMCKTGESEFSLTRISIVGWDGSVILDKLVKPDKPIIDYLTM
jgi:RNA exonuclease 1